MERKELNLKDLEAIAAGDVPRWFDPMIFGPVYFVSAADLAATGMTLAILAEKLEVDPSAILVR